MTVALDAKVDALLAVQLDEKAHSWVEAQVSIPATQQEAAPRIPARTGAAPNQQKEYPMEFVSDLPAEGSRGRKAAAYLEELRRNPGQWAVITRYPRDKANAARSRGWRLCQRHPDVQYAVRTVGDEVVLYMRAVAA